MPKIFISYRRVDSKERTHRIVDWLTLKYGEENVFLDVERLGLGKNFKELLEESLDKSDVVLIIVGNVWLKELKRREPDRAIDKDYVYIEIMRALEKPTELIIPVMIDDTSNITHEDLPAEMANITDYQYARVRENPDFHKDMDFVRDEIDKHFPPQYEPPPIILDTNMRNRLFTIGGIVGASLMTILFFTLYMLTVQPPPTLEELAQSEIAVQNEVTNIGLTAQANVEENIENVRVGETVTSIVQQTQSALLSNRDREATQTSADQRETTVAETASVLRGTITQSALLTITQSAQVQQTTVAQNVINQNATSTALANLTVTAQVATTDLANDTLATENAINQLATQSNQLTENAPTNTPEPVPSATNTPTFIPTPTDLPISMVEVGHVNIGLADTLNLYSQARTDAQIVATLNPGDLMVIMSGDEEWLQVGVLESSLTGWVSTIYIDVIGELPQSELIDLAEAYTLVTSSEDWSVVVEEFDGVPMVLAPLGCFNFGIATSEVDTLERSLNIAEDAIFDERPDSIVCINRPFWIDQFEVSQAQFLAFGGNTQGTLESIGADLPQTNISWGEARAYCELRGGYLPSEVQWEYVARGVDRFLFPWGYEFESDFYNWNRNDDVDEIEPVTDYPEGASWLGAYQMQGNVTEWTLSAYYAYPLPTISQILLSDFSDLGNEDRPIPIARGSSFLDSISGNARNTNRIPASYSERPNYFGIRCARDWQ